MMNTLFYEMRYTAKIFGDYSRFKKNPEIFWDDFVTLRPMC